ncbi:MAG TPA: hypothetical protein GXX37_07675 [Clostridiaceae bacterium]|nr:hypothetical protein [Clostridiaceae bacterium]
MGNLKIGDIVARKSYGYDIFFKVVDIQNNGKDEIATLKGITCRIQADAPASDLVVQPEEKVREYKNRVNIDYSEDLKSTCSFKKSLVLSKKQLFKRYAKG